MNQGFPQYTHSAKQGDIGVSIVSRIVADDFGWLFKRNHQEHDFGIDGQVELIAETGTVTGQMFAVQIKCGPSFLKTTNRWGYVYRGERKHFTYLANYPLPVVICLCDVKSSDAYWVLFKADQSQVAGYSWRITVPFENKLSASKQKLLELMAPVSDPLSELEAYEMTEWLGMSVEENKRITYDAFKCVGFDPPEYDGDGKIR